MSRWVQIDWLNEIERGPGRTSSDDQSGFFSSDTQIGRRRASETHKLHSQHELILMFDQEDQDFLTETMFRWGQFVLRVRDNARLEDHSEV